MKFLDAWSLQCSLRLIAAEAVTNASALRALSHHFRLQVSIHPYSSCTSRKRLDSMSLVCDGIFEVVEHQLGLLVGLIELGRILLDISLIILGRVGL